MRGTHYIGKCRNAAVITTITFVLGGCLLQDDVKEDEVSADAVIEAEYELSGSVGDGPVVGAAMRVVQNDGVLLNEFQSDASAGYNIVVKTKGKFYPLTVDARGGTDLVTNQAPDFVLIGAALEPNKKYVVNVNPFSTLSMEIARDLPGGLTKENIYAAQGIAYTAMNFGLVSLTASGPMTAEINSGNVAEIVKSSEALGEVVRRTRDWLLTAGYIWNGDDVIGALGSDLIDGVIDGLGGPRANARLAAIANLVIAQVLLESTSNEIHVNGADATSALEMAIQTMNLGTASPALGELTVTSAMLEQANVGLSAADAISADTRVTDLRQSVAGLQPGLQPELASSILPSDYRQTLDAVLLVLISGDANTIATVNDVVRNGGDISDNNNAPQISGTPDVSVMAGSMYQFLPTASDPDGDPLTFSVSNQPGWTDFDAASGSLSGMPAESDVGIHSGIVISVSDGSATRSLAAFSITVQGVVTNSPPVISGVPPAFVTANTSYIFTPFASDADNDPLTFSVVGLPIWATLDPVNGRITGAPGNAHVGTYSGIVISVSDGSATRSLPAFSITVQGAVTNSPPVISGTPPSVVTVGTLYDFTPTGSDADNDPLTYSFTGLPAWVTTSDASTGRISGTPGDADVGIYSGIIIRVSDGSATRSLPAFSITVQGVVTNSPPVISGVPPTVVTANTLYNYTPSASDADNDPLTFSVAGLPVWATFNTTDGQISGTPGDAHVGTHSGIVITVSDGQDSANLGPFSVTVEAVSLGSATLNWQPPTQNDDGTPLTDLAGYNIYWGTTPGSYSNSVTLNNPGLTTYVVDNLAPGTYEFVATAFNAAGMESQYSNTATKMIP